MQQYKTQIIVVLVLLALVVGIMSFAPASDTGQTTNGQNTTSGTGKGASSGSENLYPKTTHTVMYTSTGFSPSLLEIHAGDIVRFVNNSSGTLWVTTKGHPTLPDQNYSELDSGRSLASGEIFSLPLLRIGTWGYINLNNKNHRGAIAIQPQE